MISVERFEAIGKHRESCSFVKKGLEFYQGFEKQA